MNKFFPVVAAMGMMFAAQGGGTARPDVPDSLKAPVGEEVVLVGHATGVQIYVCQAGADQKFAWVFKAPEAELTDSTGKKIIHHFAGPTWKHVDGSEVVGKVAAKADAPSPQAIPWLLLTATSHTGEGILSRVTSIQRIHTEGGLAPNANTCDASANAKESRSAYSADYYFYKLDLTGTWNCKVVLGEQSGTPTFVLKQQGEKLTGTYSGALGDAPVTGTVKGSDVTIDFEASGAQIHYAGKVDKDGKKIEGTCDYGGQASGTFTATKKESK